MKTITVITVALILALAPLAAHAALPTGARQHKPFPVTKAVDKSSSGIAQELQAKIRAAIDAYEAMPMFLPVIVTDDITGTAVDLAKWCSVHENAGGGTGSALRTVAGLYVNVHSAGAAIDVLRLMATVAEEASVMIPRVGWEMTVGFHHGDPD